MSRYTLHHGESLGFSFTLTQTGDIATIRGVSVPEGLIAAIGLAAVTPMSREVTPRAIKMTAGIFKFAERANQPEPNEAGK